MKRSRIDLSVDIYIPTRIYKSIFFLQNTDLKSDKYPFDANYSFSRNFGIKRGK
jgi:hypothetical protein